MRLLKDQRGDAAVEWLVIAAIAIVLSGVAIYGISTNAKTQGNNVKSWIAGLNVPSTP